MGNEMDEIWELYADDGTQALDSMEELLDDLRDGSGDQGDQIGALFRAVHTFKGNSRVLGLASVEGVAHLAEDLIGLVRDEGVPLSEEILDILLLVGDNLRGMLDETARTRADVDPAPYEDLKDQLRALIAKCKGEEEEEAEAPAAEAEAPAEENTAEAEDDAADEEAEPESSVQEDDDYWDDEPSDGPAPTPPSGPVPQMDPSIAAAFEALADADDEEEDEAVEEEAAAEPEPEPEPAPKPAPKPAAAKSEPKEVQDAAGGEDFIEDPIYRKIFTDMALTTLEKLEGYLADAPPVPKEAFEEAGALAYAAEQMKLDEWQAASAKLEAAKGADDALEIAQEAIAELAALKRRDIDGEEPEDAAEDEAEEEVAEVEEDLSEEPEDEVAEEEVAEETAEEDASDDAEEEAAASTFIEDPIYRKIFSDMAVAAIEKLEGFLEASPPVPDAAFGEADSLAYAAEQMKLTEWKDAAGALEAAKGSDDAEEVLKTVVGKLKKLKTRDVDGVAEAPDSAPAAEPEPERVVEAKVRRKVVEHPPEPEAAPEPAPKAEAKPEPKPKAKAAPKKAAAPAKAEKAPAKEEKPKAKAKPAAPASLDPAEMLAAITPVVARLTHGGAMIGTDFGPSQDEIDDMVDEAMAIIEPFGYVRAVEALLTIKQQRKPEAFKAAELDLYEELASIERTLPEGSIEDASATPLACLRLWCADTISDTLTDLRTGLEHSDRSAGMNWFPNFESLMRRAYYACENYQIETAGQLTMTLVDLVARTRSTNNAPDVILIQMARGFVETMDLVFDALIQGDKPDIARIEALFEEASNCAFAASGLVTARSIEQRLGLPKEFHRVLSPDSVKAAQSAIEEGKRFFVVRADLNKDEALAEKFLSWITAGHARMITNVTIFQDDETIFDFLMATTLEEHHVVEQLANLDPEGKNLSMTMALTVAEEVESDKKKEPEHEIDAVLTDAANGVLGAENLKVIEAIGEISAGQAMIDHALSEMVEMDLMHDLTARMRANGIDEIHPRMKGVMRETFEHYLGQLRQIKEAGAQVNAKMAQLQEESVAMRSRPADVLLRPLAAFVNTQARKAGTTVRFSSTGGEVILDQMVIEELRGMLKTVMLSRLASDKTPSKIHLSVDREEDVVRVEISDNGGSFAKTEELDEIARSLSSRRGAFRRVSVPNGGVRIQISVPLHMVVLEGMVVRVGNIRYVVPIESIQRIHQGQDIVPVTAAGKKKMLRLGDGDLVPIQSLPRERDGMASGAPSLFVIARSHHSTVAIPVDELLGPQLVLLRPLRGALSGVRGMTGVAILSGGDVGMVVSVSRVAGTA